jgi:hypothetical protein
MVFILFVTRSLAVWKKTVNYFNAKFTGLPSKGHRTTNYFRLNQYTSEASGLRILPYVLHFYLCVCGLYPYVISTG